MSRENVERTYQAHDAFNRRDPDAFLALMHPDTEFLPYELAVQGGPPYRGHDGMRTWWEESLEVLPDLKVELHEARDSDSPPDSRRNDGCPAQSRTRPVPSLGT